MYRNLIDRVLICKIGTVDAPRLEVVKVLSVIPSQYISEEGWAKYAEAGLSSSPAATINNTSNFLTFWVMDIETNRTFRVNEYEAIYDVTNLKTKKQIQSKLDELIESDRHLKIQSIIGNLGFDSHYIKCIDVGMDQLQALKAIRELIELKIKNNEDGDE